MKSIKQIHNAVEKRIERIGKIRDELRDIEGDLAGFCDELDMAEHELLGCADVLSEMRSAIDELSKRV